MAGHRIRFHFGIIISMVSKTNLFEQVYEIVRQIPKEKVTTYGAIARRLGTKDARKIGFALHANPDPETPCHRVVNKDGGLADSYAFGGWEKQKEKLLAEGVIFASEKIVDLKKWFWE